MHCDPPNREFGSASCPRLLRYVNHLAIVTSDTSAWSSALANGSLLYRYGGFYSSRTADEDGTHRCYET